jgi:hypothetical protein
LTINFGLIDLIDGYTGYVDQARNQVLDAGWGLVFGVILPLGLLAQLHRPERRIAGLQQTAVVAFAVAIAGAAGEAWGYLALAAGIAGACALLVLLHPARRTFLAQGQRLDAVMLALAGVAAVPALVYARRMASAQRRDLPPADAVSNGLHHWTVMTALALIVLLLVLLAAVRTSGWRIPATSASVAAGAWAISCLLAPAAAAGSEGHAWAWGVLGWAVVTLTVAAVSRPGDYQPRRIWQWRTGPSRDALLQFHEHAPAVSDPFAAEREHVALRVAMHLDEPDGAKLCNVVVGDGLQSSAASQSARRSPAAFHYRRPPRVDLARRNRRLALRRPDPALATPHARSDSGRMRRRGARSRVGIRARDRSRVPVAVVFLTLCSFFFGLPMWP